jgi:hypothetical protein
VQQLPWFAAMKGRQGRRQLIANQQTLLPWQLLVLLLLNQLIMLGLLLLLLW